MKAWKILITKIRYVTILNQILEEGSPSQGWSVFFRILQDEICISIGKDIPTIFFFEDGQWQETGKIHQPVFCIEKQVRILRHEISRPYCFPVHLVGSAPFDHAMIRALLPSRSDWTLSVVLEVMMDAFEEKEIEREEEQRNSMRHAFVANGNGRGGAGGQQGPPNHNNQPNPKQPPSQPPSNYSNNNNQQPPYLNHNNNQSDHRSRNGPNPRDRTRGG